MRSARSSLLSLNEVRKMTEQERINFALQRQMEKLDAKIQIQIDAQTARMNVMDARIDSALAELKEQRQDIRELNKKMDDNQKEFMQQLHNNFVQTLIGVGAIMVAVGGLIIAVLK